MQLDKLGARSSSWPRYRYRWKESFNQKGLARAQMSVSDYLPQVGMRFGFSPVGPWVFCLGFLWRVNLSVSRVALILFRFVVYKFAFRFGFVLLSNCVNTVALRLSGVHRIPFCHRVPWCPNCRAWQPEMHCLVLFVPSEDRRHGPKERPYPYLSSGPKWCVSF